MNRTLRRTHRRAAWLMALIGPAIVAALVAAAVRRASLNDAPSTEAPAR